jgi:hypothetical protein
MCLLYILGLVLILVIAIIIFILSCNQSNEIINPTPTIEKWSNMDDTCPNDDNSPLYAGCNGFNCPLDKRKTKRAFYDDGYKLEDDRYQCLCKCTRKCNPQSGSSNNNKNKNKKKHRIGERLAVYPWFSQTPL